MFGLWWVLSAALILPAATNDGDDAYRAWLDARIAGVARSEEPDRLATAVALHQQLCAGSDDGMSEEWLMRYRLAAQARRPASLALIANVAATRHEHDAAERWAAVVRADPSNLYPVVMLAATRWARGDHAQAQEALRQASGAHRWDDYFASITSAVKRIVEENPPSANELSRCVREGLPPDATQTEINATAVFHLAEELSFGPHALEPVALCREAAAAANATISEACRNLGRTIQTTATSSLGRGVGFGMQRFAARSTEEQSRIEAQQQDANDALYAALWWTDDGGSHRIRQRAIALWLDELSKHGELPAADALVRRFGPDPETLPQRQARVSAYMDKLQTCYAESHGRR